MAGETLSANHSVPAELCPDVRSCLLSWLTQVRVCFPGIRSKQQRGGAVWRRAAGSLLRADGRQLPAAEL